MACIRNILTHDSLSFHAENASICTIESRIEISKQLVRRGTTDQLCITQGRLPLLHLVSHHIHILLFQSCLRVFLSHSLKQTCIGVALITGRNSALLTGHRYPHYFLEIHISIKNGRLR